MSPICITGVLSEGRVLLQITPSSPHCFSDSIVQLEHQTSLLVSRLGFRSFEELRAEHHRCRGVLFRRAPCKPDKRAATLPPHSQSPGFPPEGGPKV